MTSASLHSIALRQTFASNESVTTFLILRQAQYSTRRPTRLDKIKSFHAALQAGGVVLGIATANDLLLDLTIGMKYVWQSWVRRLVSPLGAPEERSQHVQLDDALHRRGVPVRQAKLTPDGLEFSEDVSEAKWVEESLSDFGTVRAI